MAIDWQILRPRFEKHHQSQVLQVAEQFSLTDQLALYDQLNQVNLESLQSSIAQALESEKIQEKGTLPHLEPIASEQLTILSHASSATVSQWRERGMRALRDGQVAVVLLAGGMGTRLGYSGPKGTYDFGLPSHRTLFQWHAERLKRLEKLSGTCGHFPWYILVSRENVDATRSFFEMHHYFNLKQEQIMFFLQQEIPCVSIHPPYSLLLKSTREVATSPDGNGGVFEALHRYKCLEDMRQRGVRYLHVFGVDNCLVLPGDPVFIGHCIERNVECGAKVIAKKHAHESVGVFCRKKDAVHVIEYSELSAALAEKRDAQGQLIFNAANIVNHFFTLSFVNDVILPGLDKPGFMSYHISRKKVPYIDEQGQEMKPMQPNAIKLERFIFDVFPYADVQRVALLQVEREHEFAPIKNAPGSIDDSPDTARQLLYSLHKHWLQIAGAHVKETIPPTICEISPNVSYSGENLEVFRGNDLTSPILIENLPQ